MRRERAETIQQQFGSFELQAVVVHWDGKLLPAVTGKETVDRLAVVISSEDTKQMLGVPTLKAGTGREQADAVFQTLVEWDLTEMVKAICFDTTSSNIWSSKWCMYFVGATLGSRTFVFTLQTSYI